MKKIRMSYEGQGCLAWAFCSIAAAMLAGTIYIFVC
jgi:hypothetical protein